MNKIFVALLCLSYSSLLLAGEATEASKPLYFSVVSQERIFHSESPAPVSATGTKAAKTVARQQAIDSLKARYHESDPVWVAFGTHLISLSLKERQAYSTYEMRLKTRGLFVTFTGSSPEVRSLRRLQLHADGQDMELAPGDLSVVTWQGHPTLKINVHIHLPTAITEALHLRVTFVADDDFPSTTIQLGRADIVRLIPKQSLWTRCRAWLTGP